MTISLAGVVGDASDLWRRHRTLLLALAGPFLFLPLFAWLLLVAEPAPLPDASSQDRVQMMIAFAQANLHWLALRMLIELFGGASVLVLVLSRAHRTLGEALGVTLRLLPIYAGAMLVCWIAIGLGVFAFIVPGLYLLGRLALTGPVLAAEPGTGVAEAIVRSFALTRQRGWLVFGYVGLTLLAGLLVAQVFGGMAAAMDQAGAVNPVARAVLNALAAAGVAATVCARLLMEAALYRRLAGSPR